MSQTEAQVILTAPEEASNDAIFSHATRTQALGIISEKHGGLVRAFSGPVINIYDWIINRQPDIQDASNVIEARKRFNSAANDATHGAPPEEQVKKIA